jgi:hypothetical protein
MMNIGFVKRTTGENLSITIQICTGNFSPRINSCILIVAHDTFTFTKKNQSYL